MDPITGVTLLTTLVGLGFNLVGQAQESAAARREALENKKLADAAAADAMARGYREAGLARAAGAQNVAAQTVAAAASGVDPTVGTPAQVAAGSAALSALDAATLENNAAREAWGFKTQGLAYGRAAERERAALPMRQMTSILGAGDRFVSAYDAGQRRRYGRTKAER
jgi:hypothetical protein